MEKKILLFDIDSVIFDTEKFRSWRNNKVQEIAQIDSNRARIIFKEVKPICFKECGGYEPRYYAELVAQALDREAILPALVDVLEGAAYEDFHYQEVEKAIRALADSENFIIGIQSEGDPKTQKDKLGNLIAYFDPAYMFFYQTDKINALKNDILQHLGLLKNNVIVVDDRPQVILPLQKAGIRAILVRQGKYATEASPDELTLNSLQNNLFANILQTVFS